MAGRQAGFDRIIGFDMGGTSTDVCRFDGDFDYQFEHRVGRARVLAPVLNIETVAAGGGSICGFNGEELFVGPESAGAHPGPPVTAPEATHGYGCQSAARSARPGQFGIPVNLEAAREALEAIRSALPEPTAEEELLAGFLEIANERMADAVEDFHTGRVRSG